MCVCVCACVHACARARPVCPCIYIRVCAFAPRVVRARVRVCMRAHVCMLRMGKMSCVRLCLGLCSVILVPLF